MWHTLRPQRIDIGSEQTARLIRLTGVAGKPKGPNNRAELVNRDLTVHKPNRLWVADITYVRTRKSFVYAAFVTDVFARPIGGWALYDPMRTEALPSQALNQAIACTNGNDWPDSPFRPRLAIRQHWLKPASC